MMRPVEGSLLLADKINQAYTRHLFNDTYVVTGMQFMPFKPAVRQEAEKILNVVGDLIYPILTTLSLPVFLHNMVLEKEQRLIQNMKINGLRMRNYWIVTCCYNFCVYMIAVLVYYAFGRYVSGLTFFTETNPTILMVSLVGWGLNQVALSFLFSCFLDSS